MTKFPNLMKTLDGLVKNFAHKKSIVHKGERVTGYVFEMISMPELGVHTPSQAMIFCEQDYISLFYTEDEHFTQIHDDARSHPSFANLCLLKIRHPNTEREMIQVHMIVLQKFMHMMLKQRLISGHSYEKSLEEMQHLFSKETMEDYLEVCEWIHRHDNDMFMQAA